MQSFTHAGITYRTKLMTKEQADRFARCLSGNRAFTQVQVTEPPRSPGKFFVSFLPASEQRQAAMKAREQDKREALAGSEGRDYLFVLDDSRRFFWCQSTSGEVYETTERGCSCPDFHYRCQRAGVRCKHQLALAQALRDDRAFLL